MNNLQKCIEMIEANPSLKLALARFDQREKIQTPPPVLRDIVESIQSRRNVSLYKESK